MRMKRKRTLNLKQSMMVLVAVAVVQWCGGAVASLTVRWSSGSGFDAGLSSGNENISRKIKGFFRRGPEQAWQGYRLQSYANYMSEVLDSLLSILTHTWTDANKNKLSNVRMSLQFGCPNRTKGEELFELPIFFVLGPETGSLSCKLGTKQALKCQNEPTSWWSTDWMVKTEN